MKKLFILLTLITYYLSLTTASAQDRHKLDSLWNAFKQAKHDTTKIKTLLTIGEQFERTNPDTSIHFYKQGLNLSEKNFNHELSAKCNRYLAYVYGNILYNLEKCEQFYVEAIKCYAKIDDKKSIADCYNKIATVHANQGSYDQAIAYYLKSLNIFEELLERSGNPDSEAYREVQKGMSVCYGNIGNIHIYQGSYDRALEYYLKSLKILEELGNKKGMATCYGNIGSVHIYQGGYDKALEYYLKSLKIDEELGDKKGMARCYVNIGSVYIYQGSYDKALEYYLKSLKIDEELGDKKGMSDCYGNIGAIHYNQGSYDKALEYFLKSLKIDEELGDKKGMANCYGNIGNVHNDQGSYDKALVCLLKSLKILEESGDKFGIALSYGNIANLHITLADSSDLLGAGGRAAHLDSAVVYGNKAIELAKEIESSSLIYQFAGTMQKCYKSKGNYKKALEYAEIFIETKDTIFSEEKTKSLAEMGAKYEAEKKQLQIDNLNKENALKQAELAQSEEKRSKQLMLIYSFVAGFIIILVFALIIFRLFMQKKKANLLLARQKQQIEIQNVNLNQANEEITSQRDEIAAQRDLVTKQKDHIEEQKQEITDSINYAKRIQTAVLPDLAVIAKAKHEAISQLKSDCFVPRNDADLDSFILFKPKDIVSGDFYWATKTNEWLIVTVADCTGHGVPGAFMSMLGVSFLNEIVRKKEVTKASDVLDHLRESIIEALSQTGETGTQKDGMDIVLCAINTTNNQLQFAGANNSLYIVSSSNLEDLSEQTALTNQKPQTSTELASSTKLNLKLFEFKPDKQPVAIYEHMKPFTNHIIQLNSGDALYLMSDGYQDQFGGPNGKKFLSKNLKQLLIANCQLSMENQKQILEKTLIEWIGEGEQIDDITILGIKV